jgi:hypothetical protein
MPVSIDRRFKDLLLAAVADEKFDAVKVAYALSHGFDRAMGNIKGQVHIPYEERDALMDRLVEIEGKLERWANRDEWEPILADY